MRERLDESKSYVKTERWGFCVMMLMKIFEFVRIGAGVFIGNTFDLSSPPIRFITMTKL